MASRALLPRLVDIIEAIGHIESEMRDVPLEIFEADWRRRWLVERGLEIISEASRRLPDPLKARHKAIPWPKVAGIGNVLRHGYESISPSLLWALVRDDLPPLEKACREEAAAESACERGEPGQK